MAKRDEFAQFHPDVLCRGDRINSLGGALTVPFAAYVKLWALCVELRRDTYHREQLACTQFALKAGVTPECMAELLASELDSGKPRSLLSRGPGGIITIDRLRTCHKGLRGWNESPLILDCGIESIREDPESLREREERESEKGPQTFSSIVKAVKEGKCRRARRLSNGVIYHVFPPEDGGEGLVLNVGDGTADAIRCFSPKDIVGIEFFFDSPGPAAGQGGTTKGGE